MNAGKRILIAIDSSEASMQAVSYVATIMGGQSDFQVCLFHVLGPFPPELLESRGSESIEAEEKIEAKLRAAQTRWVEKAEKAAQPTLAKAKSILREARVPEQAVETQFSTSVSKREVAPDILEAAGAGKYDTIVVGRESFSRLKGLFQHHVGDELIRKGQGFTVWVVE